MVTRLLDLKVNFGSYCIFFIFVFLNPFVFLAENRNLFYSASSSNSNVDYIYKIVMMMLVLNCKMMKHDKYY